MMRGSMYISDDKHSIHPQRAHIRLSNTKRKGGRKASTYMLFSPYPYPYNSSNSTLWKEYSLSTIWWCGVLKPLSYYDYDNDNGMENQIVTLQIEPSHNSYANSMRWWLGPENQKGVKQYIRVMHWYIIVILFGWERDAEKRDNERKTYCNTRRDISSYAYYVYHNKALCVGKDTSTGSRGLFGGCASSLSVQGTYTCRLFVL